jgi:hypothetical protein
VRSGTCHSDDVISVKREAMIVTGTDTASFLRFFVILAVSDTDNAPKMFCFLPPTLF